jgi:hypothetical protein
MHSLNISESLNLQLNQFIYLFIYLILASYNEILKVNTKII